jgi:hypothetical integral membrane protein (TIGR02206 family)
MTDLPQIVVSPGDWTTFHPYGAMHFVTVLVCLLVIVAVTAAGHMLRADRKAAFCRAIGIFGLAYWVSYNVWWMRHARDLAVALPLHICDLNGVIAPLMLLTGNRWLRATCYFWTFALTTQAFIQPELVFGPSRVEFWWFWVQHTIILGCAVVDILVLGFRPDWRDLGRAYAASAIYILAVVPVNALLRSNYGYIGDPPPPARIPPLIDALGPWPLRAVIVVILAAAGFVVVLLPWRLIRPAQRGTAKAGG